MTRPQHQIGLIRFDPREWPGTEHQGVVPAFPSFFSGLDHFSVVRSRRLS